MCHARRMTAHRATFALLSPDDVSGIVDRFWLDGPLAIGASTRSTSCAGCTPARSR
jgi:hypothetical protein